MISKRITQQTVEISVEELAKFACIGQTWTCALFEGNHDSDSWISQSIFALDFECGILPEVLLGRLKDQGLDCTFAYTSFSSAPDFLRYRFVWKLDHEVKDTAEQYRIMYALKEILPEHNSQAVSPDQVFYGGQELIYENYDYCLNLPRLFVELGILTVGRSNAQNISRDLKRLEKKLINTTGMKNGNAYKNYYRQDQISSKTAHKKELAKVDWEALTQEIRVLKDFESGQQLTYLQYFGLASNLLHLNGGVALYKKSLNKMIELNQQQPEFSELLKAQPEFLNKLYNLPSVLKFYGYPSETLENYSPYEEDWIYSNLRHAGRKSEMVRFRQYDTISLAEAEQKFDADFNAAIQSQDTNVYIFKVSTGLGKTTRLKDLQGVLIAFPNHDLKDEVAEKMKVPVKVTPRLPQNLPSTVEDTIDYYFSIGAIKEANRFIAEEAKNNQELADYLKALNSAYAAGETVLTTHPKALFIEFNQFDTIIFDEDPLLSLLSIGSISVNDLRDLQGRLTDEADKQLIENYLQSLTTAEKNCPLKAREIEPRSFEAIQAEVLDNSYKCAGNVLAFFQSDWYMADLREPAKIHFIRINPLPVDRKVIILSATVDEQIYKQLYGDRVKFYDLSNVEMMGVIEQDSTYTLSRTSLQSEKAVAYAQKQVENLPTLTYKTRKDLFPNAMKEMHFGKLSGFDHLKGQDIAIIGAFHRNPVVYLLSAVALGIEFMPEDTRMQRQAIERHGIRFPFITYTHEGLRNIQLFFLESEQEQAIGRARPLRCQVSIRLLSNLPHPQACINEDEKKLKQRKLNALQRRNDPAPSAGN
ncbi:MAG: hypothetical protein KME18_24035 [Phormidium tanganyikae FI6-MK23]|nr:hypothetical protein [Phormidium tanganyikae FI6-MK23]